MPINNFRGNTFVAFMDISGFKQLMRQNKAIQALDCFYNESYHVLLGTASVEGLFVSDSGILFVKDQDEDTGNRLSQMLEVIKQINCKMLDRGYMLTTSIAFGEFSYHQRIEFPGIEKNPVYGQAYVSAFLDNENVSPRIQPGQCRIVLNPLLNNTINKDDLLNSNPLLKFKHGDNNHIYYYWNVHNPLNVEQFEAEYVDAYQAKFAGMLQALKNSRNI